MRRCDRSKALDVVDRQIGKWICRVVMNKGSVSRSQKGVH
jgi:hypothetical protein